MDYRNQTFPKGDVQLDGNTFTNCTFMACHLVYSGTGPILFNNCVFEKETEWVLKGPAASALKFLASLYQTGKTGRQFVEQTFKNIRQGRY